MAIDHVDLVKLVASIAALGTAAYGLVDATKVFRGGVSNVGFGFVRDAVAPYSAALALTNSSDPLATVRANWLNGVPKADQKATVKSLIRLGLTVRTVDSLVSAAPGIDAAALKAAASKIDSGQPLGEQDINVLGRFDAILDAQMDAGFERADQQYRNGAKALAVAFATALSVLGVWWNEGNAVTMPDFMLALLVGAASTPLAPVAKDLSSALGVAVAAMKAVKG